MKLRAGQAPTLFARPPEGWPGLLIYGADAMRVAEMRAQAVAVLAGPDAEAEMRLARLSAEELRRDPAALDSALKAQGFFPGPRVVVLEGASDGLASALGAALQDWQPGDARLVATAGSLKPVSALRKLFEGHRAAHALPLYDDPPDRDAVAAMLRAAGLGLPEPPVMAGLMALAEALEPGDLRQTVEKLALYKHGDSTPMSVEDLAAAAPLSVEAALEAVLHATAEARPAEVGPLIRRLEAQGVTPVALCIGAGRHFRTLHAALADPAGGALAAVRHPPTRERMQRQLRGCGWTQARLETALGLILDADLALRSSARAPAMPVMERALIRISMLARSRDR